MAAKIKMTNITSSYNDIMGIINSKYLKEISWDEEIKTSSSDRFSSPTSYILEFTLSYIILVAASYYKLKNENDKLPRESIDDLNSAQSSNTMKIWQECEEEAHQIDFYKRLINTYPIDLTKKQFFERKRAQRNSVSNEHNQALNRSDNNHCSKNIILKIIGAGAEAAQIRIGIAIDNQKTYKVKLMNIVNKRTKTK